MKAVQSNYRFEFQISLVKMFGQNNAMSIFRESLHLRPFQRPYYPGQLFQDLANRAFRRLRKSRPTNPSYPQDPNGPRSLNTAFVSNCIAVLIRFVKCLE